jgi:hypothetical protein
MWEALCDFRSLSFDLYGAVWASTSSSGGTVLLQSFWCGFLAFSARSTVPHFNSYFCIILLYR